MELDYSQKSPVHRPTKVPKEGSERNPVQYDELLGKEPRRACLPDRLHLRVADCAHEEVIHLEEGGDNFLAAGILLVQWTGGKASNGGVCISYYTEVYR